MADDHRYSCRKQDTQIFTHFSRNSSHSYYHQPSFSSSLLDSIYRSIEEEMVSTYEEPIRRNKMENLKSEKELMANLRRASMIEKWMEKKVTEKPGADVKSLRKDRRSSSTSSSDSSCAGGGGFFSSSESESFPVRRPKPVRTGVSGFDQKEKLDQNRRDRSGSGKADGGFSKTKSRALKMYGDLKKEKWQPISPGGKVAAFLNSLFAGGGSLRKPKISSDYSPSLKSTTCSSASSFSRSCLSKTPASSKSSGGGAKRSVRFFPLSVIVGEDCQPCGHKSLHRENESAAIDEELIRHIMEKNRRAEEAEGDSLMSYNQKKISHEFEILRKTHIENLESDHDFDGEDDDFDTASCASSDLFELDNLSEIGMERYSEELPVYETTHLDTNRAILRMDQ